MQHSESVVQRKKRNSSFISRVRASFYFAGINEGGDDTDNISQANCITTRY